jgi:hypothetical protein
MGDATVGALAVSARALSAVTMATPVDPIVTAIARDRKSQTDEGAHEAASGVGEDACSEPADDGVWRQKYARRPFARRSRRSVVRR